MSSTVYQFLRNVLLQLKHKCSAESDRQNDRLTDRLSQVGKSYGNMYIVRVHTRWIAGSRWKVVILRRKENQHLYILTKLRIFLEGYETNKTKIKFNWTCVLQGEVDYAVVTSPCDNVIHSLVNTSRYTGLFLPGFLPIKDDIADSSSADHDYIRDGVLYNLTSYSLSLNSFSINSPLFLHVYSLTGHNFKVLLFNRTFSKVSTILLKTQKNLSILTLYCITRHGRLTK